MDKIGQLIESGFFGGIVIAATFSGAAVFLYPGVAGPLISYSAWKKPCCFMDRIFPPGNGYYGNCGLSRAVQRVTGLETGWILWGNCCPARY